MKSVISNGDGTSSVVALEDGNLITGMVQDCTPILERTKALHREGQHGSSDFKHAATLPNYAIERYCHINGITFAEWMRNPFHIKAMLNDPDLRDFRIWPGRV